MNCDSCENNKKKIEPVDYFVHEADMARVERSAKRAWILSIILAVIAFAEAIGFFIYESQFEDVVIEAEQSADTGNNYAVGGDYNGYEAESND